MSQYFLLSVRLPVVAIWLALVFLTQHYAVARWVLAALAGATICLYAGVVVGGLLELWIAPPHGSFPVPFYGVLLGGSVGALVGLAVGLICARNSRAYWVLQCTTAAVVLLVPLK